MVGVSYSLTGFDFYNAIAIAVRGSGKGPNMKLRATVFFFVLSCVVHGPLAAQALNTGTMGTPAKLQRFIERLDADKNTLQGGAIAVFYKGQVIYKTTFGKRKGSYGPVTSRTLFPLASVSKPVSAVALALMADKGNLSFDEKFNLPYLNNKVSLSNILSHTTGYPFKGNKEIEQGLGRQKLLRRLKTQKPACNPGACYTYSNTTFSLVEEVLNAKQSSLKSAVQQLKVALNTDGIQIMPIPAHMDIAYPHRGNPKKKNQALKALPFPPYYPIATPASAGVFASLDGMIEFFKLSFGYRPDLISHKTLNALYKPMFSNRDIDKWAIDWPSNKKDIESYYGLGWRILKQKQRANKQLIYHSGFIAGINTFIGFMPADDIGIILLVNESSSAFPVKRGLSLWAELLKK